MRYTVIELVKDALIPIGALAGTLVAASAVVTLLYFPKDTKPPTGRGTSC